MNWSAFWGGFVGNIADVAIIILLIKVLHKLVQFKEEGEDDLYLK